MHRTTSIDERIRKCQNMYVAYYNCSTIIHKGKGTRNGEYRQMRRARLRSPVRHRLSLSVYDESAVVPIWSSWSRQRRGRIALPTLSDGGTESIYLYIPKLFLYIVKIARDKHISECKPPPPPPSTRFGWSRTSRKKREKEKKNTNIYIYKGEGRQVLYDRAVNEAAGILTRLGSFWLDFACWMAPVRKSRSCGIFSLSFCLSFLFSMYILFLECTRLKCASVSGCIWKKRRRGVVVFFFLSKVSVLMRWRHATSYQSLTNRWEPLLCLFVLYYFISRNITNARTELNNVPPNFSAGIIS